MSEIQQLASHCIRCGFCLESCPTFKLTGDETRSPRGRIYLARLADEGKLDWVKGAAPALDSCLGCMACETACPSGVEYGVLLELAKQKVESERPNRAKSLLLSTLTNSKLLKLQSLIPGRRIPRFLTRGLSSQKPVAERPIAEGKYLWPPIELTPLPPIKGEVAVLEGCVMPLYFQRASGATKRLLRRVGFTSLRIKDLCCGALHAHNGHLNEAKLMASKVFEAIPKSIPLIVNSAGCGSFLKECVPQGQVVLDITEFLLREGLVEALQRAPGFTATVTYHDACHLCHAQGVVSPPRELIGAIPGLNVVELEEHDTCCGSAGIYNLTNPKMAKRLLDRKWKNIAKTGATIVATGNPGCLAWIAQAARESGTDISIVHTTELLESGFIGPTPLDDTPASTHPVEPKFG